MINEVFVTDNKLKNLQANVSGEKKESAWMKLRSNLNACNSVTLPNASSLTK